MIKHYIQQPEALSYTNTRARLEEKYGNSHHIFAAYRREIGFWPQLKPADGPACIKFYNFAILMCLVLSNLPVKTRDGT